MQIIDVFSDRPFVNVVVWVLVHLNLNVKIKSLSHLQRQDRTQKTEQHGKEYKLHFVSWVLTLLNDNLARLWHATVHFDHFELHFQILEILFYFNKSGL